MCPWALENSLVLNGCKLQAIVFSEHEVGFVVQSVVLNDVIVHYASTVLNLGVVMDCAQRFL